MSNESNKSNKSNKIKLGVSCLLIAGSSAAFAAEDALPATGLEPMPMTEEATGSTMNGTVGSDLGSDATKALDMAAEAVIKAQDATETARIASDAAKVASDVAKMATDDAAKATEAAKKATQAAGGTVSDDTTSTNGTGATMSTDMPSSTSKK